MNAKTLEVFLLGVGGAPSRKECMANGYMTKASNTWVHHANAPPPSTLLPPPFPPSRSEHRGPSRAAASRTEAMRAKTTPLVLGVLLNLCRASPTAMTAWLTTCAPAWSSWGALKGLEAELNNREEEVILDARFSVCGTS